jgi:hypothetical protein
MNIFVGNGKDTEEFVMVDCPYLEYLAPDGREKILAYSKEADIPPDVRKEFDVATKFRRLKGKFRMPDFKMHNDLFRESTTYRPNGDPYTSTHLFKINVLKKLLVRIELDNQAAEIDDKNYGSIDPTIAEALYEAFYTDHLSPILTLDELKSLIKK